MPGDVTGVEPGAAYRLSPADAGGEIDDCLRGVHRPGDRAFVSRTAPCLIASHGSFPFGPPPLTEPVTERYAEASPCRSHDPSLPSFDNSRALIVERQPQIRTVMIHAGRRWSKAMLSEVPDLVNEGEARRIIGGATTPISRATLWRGIRAGRYPSPLKVGPASNRWRRDELIAVIEDAAARR